MHLRTTRIIPTRACLIRLGERLLKKMIGSRLVTAKIVHRERRDRLPFQGRVVVRVGELKLNCEPRLVPKRAIKVALLVPHGRCAVAIAVGAVTVAARCCARLRIARPGACLVAARITARIADFVAALVTRAARAVQQGERGCRSVVAISRSVLGAPRPARLAGPAFGAAA